MLGLLVGIINRYVNYLNVNYLIREGFGRGILSDFLVVIERMRSKVYGKSISGRRNSTCKGCVLGRSLAWWRREKIG